MSCQEIDNKVSGQVTQTQLLILGMSLSLLPSPLIGCRGRRLLLLAVTLVYTCQLPIVSAGDQSSLTTNLRAKWIIHGYRASVADCGINACLLVKKWTNTMSRFEEHLLAWRPKTCRYHSYQRPFVYLCVCVRVWCIVAITRKRIKPVLVWWLPQRTATLY